jgi:hypothetical protein
MPIVTRDCRLIEDRIGVCPLKKQYISKCQYYLECNIKREYKHEKK